jgi:hypothetical protein
MQGRDLCGVRCRCTLVDMASSAARSRAVRQRRKAAGLCVTCGKRPSRIERVTCQKCADAWLIRDRARRARGERRYPYNPARDRPKKNAAYRRIREEVIAHYGGTCACCGESEPLFLEIDHIHGGGGTHRRADPAVKANIYRWLRRNRYPDGFQVLCSNCNNGKARNGGVCPHLGGQV